MDELKPYYTLQPLALFQANSDNYKIHTPEQIQALKASLLRFGQVKPVVVRQITHYHASPVYELIAGHGITQAARELVAEHADNLIIATFRDAWACIVVPSSWSEAEARAYMIADNELSRLAEDNTAKLLALLEEQRDLNADLASVGYSVEELDRLLADLGDEIYNDAEEEKRERSLELAAPNGGQVGQVYNVVVECENESDQQAAYTLLVEEGYTCHLNTL